MVKTLTLAAAKLQQFHEAQDAPAFATELIGSKQIPSLEVLDSAYRELVSLGVLRASPEPVRVSVAGSDSDIERPLYSVR